MVETRTYILHSDAGFDGLTIQNPPQANWLRPWTDYNQNALNRLAAPDRIGRFTPRMLGRIPEFHGLALVWTDGPIGDGDGIEVRGSLDVLEADPPDQIRRPLTPVTLSPDTATPILLSPGDDLCLTGFNIRTFHVTITDISAKEFFNYARELAGGGSDCCVEPTTRALVGGSQMIEPWVGTLYASASLATAGDVLTLPPSGSMRVGARLLLTRQGGPWIRLTAALGDTLNGRASGDGFDLTEDDEGLIVELAAGNAWRGTKYVPSRATITLTNNVPDATVPLAAWSGDQTLRVDWIARGAVRLPDVTQVALGQRLLVVRGVGSAAVHLITFGLLEEINGVSNGTAFLEGSGGALALERVPGGWVALRLDGTGAINPSLVVVAAGTTLEPWAGLEVVDLAIPLTGGTTLLPALASVPTGSRVLVRRTGGVLQHRIAAQPGEAFNGVAGGGVNLVLRERPIEIIRTDVGWVSPGPPGAADELTIMVGNLTLTDGWLGLRAFNLGAGTTLDLPPSNVLTIGTQALCRPAGAGTTINAGASNICRAGVLAPALALAVNVPVLLTWNGSEWCGD